MRYEVSQVSMQCHPINQPKQAFFMKRQQSQKRKPENNIEGYLGTESDGRDKFRKKEKSKSNTIITLRQRHNWNMGEPGTTTPCFVAIRLSRILAGNLAELQSPLNDSLEF